MHVRRSVGARRVVLEPDVPVFVPAHPRNDHQDVGFELRTADGGGLVIICFTTKDRLVAELGEFQPWVCGDAGTVLAYARRANMPLSVDPRVPPSAPRWTADDLAEFIGGIA